MRSMRQLLIVLVLIAHCACGDDEVPPSPDAGVTATVVDMPDPECLGDDCPD